MTESKTPLKPNIPDIKKCPRCGANILLGDTKCSNCGYAAINVSDTLRATSPTFIAVVCLFLGAALMLASTGMDDLMQFLFLGGGFAIVIGGGVYMALNILVSDPKRRRKKL
ncbi:MAG: hypothetical protein HY862_09680 [Chloroflexi bacterium]|nr:hypothetical protein [Chloroflexota bacterium]